MHKLPHPTFKYNMLTIVNKPKKKKQVHSISGVANAIKNLFKNSASLSRANT